MGEFAPLVGGLLLQACWEAAGYRCRMNSTARKTLDGVVAAASLALLSWVVITVDRSVLLFAVLSALVAALFVACYLAPKTMVRIISMPYAFRLRENFGPRALRMQVTTYASFHTTLLADLTHTGLLIDAVAWTALITVVFGPAGLVLVGLVAGFQIWSFSDSRFARVAIPTWIAVGATGIVAVDRLGEERAVTLAVATILVTSVWRVVGHAGEPIPPGVSGTYGFVPLEDLGVRPTIGLSALLGIVAEAASGIPFRLFLPWLYDTSVRHFGLEFDTPLDRARIREEREAIFQSGWGGAPSTRYLLDIDRAVRRAPARPSSLPPFPAGWYAVAFSDDLQPGSLESMTFCGREIVVFRTTSGRAVAMAAHCPHLGAHLGVGGQVEGETVRCPFHGFCFDETGACVSTGYGTAPPKSLAAEMFEIREIDGIVLVWHHPSDSAPTFEVTPSASRPVRRIHTMYVIRDHPQETTENSVDLGHFAHIHGYGSVAIIEPLSCDGPTLRIGYRATRVMPWSRRPIEFEFRPQVDGLGVSRVQVSVPSIDLRADLHVLPTPTDGEHVELRLALGLHPIARKRTLHPLAGLVPRSLLEWLVARSTLEAFAGDAFDDFPIWENKAYIERPRLAVGDGPIGRYRTWARQFYIEPVEHQAGGPHLVIDLTTDEDHAAVHDRANPVATAPPENPTSDGVL